MRCRYDLVLFDLDGTLVDSAPEIADAVNDTLAELGLPAEPLERVQAWIGNGTGVLLLRALAAGWGKTLDEVRADPAFAGAAARFDRHYAARCGSRSSVYPRARELLAALRADGVRLAVLTNKEARYTRALLDAHGLRPLLDLVVSGDTLPVRKPDPAMARYCIDWFSASTPRTLLVGDSAIDAATARNAGIAGWLLPHGYNGGVPVAQAGADRVVADFGALHALLLPEVALSA